MTQSKQIISESAKIITTDLSGRLPARPGAVRLRDLVSYEIPDFVISGIEREIDKNLVDTFVMPETDWAVTDRPEVAKAWENLLFELRKDYSFPAQKASDIIGEVVVEILNLLVCPRKCIPEKLFGSDSKVDSDTLNERARSIFVQKHLAMAPVRYLYRKNLDTLTLEQCRRVVSQVDEKLIIRYETRNWTDLLDAVFQLTGDSADPRLLSLYFQDKMRPHAAQRFDSLQGGITRNVLEKILREVDMSQSSESSGGQFIGEYSSGEEDSGEESGTDGSGSSVSERFYLEMKESGGEKRDEDRSEIWKYDGEKARDSGGHAVVQDGQETGAWSNGFEQENEGEQDYVHNPEDSESREQEESYIWQNFISSEMDEEPNDDRNRISQTLAGEFLEEETDCSGDLIEWLGNDEGRIVKEIFGDSQKAFKEAMAALAEQDDWGSGAAYIKKDIFSRYRIDMYDEVAVDFTDKMHSWFIENKSA